MSAPAADEPPGPSPVRLALTRSRLWVENDELIHWNDAGEVCFRAPLSRVASVRLVRRPEDFAFVILLCSLGVGAIATFAPDFGLWPRFWFYLLACGGLGLGLLMVLERKLELVLRDSHTHAEETVHVTVAETASQARAFIWTLREMIGGGR